MGTLRLLSWDAWTVECFVRIAMGILKSVPMGLT
jgi:hypothetical protein